MDKKIILEICLVGHQGAGWPKIRIDFNNQCLIDQQIVDELIINQTVNIDNTNQLTITHYDKQNDTLINTHGNIIADRYCELKYIKLNGLYFNINFFSTHNYYYQADDGEKLITTYLGKSGKFVFDFPSPLWKFWYKCQHNSVI